MNRIGTMRSISPLAGEQSPLSSAQTLRGRPARNRPPFSLALIPLALLGITCGFSLVQRAAASITHSDTSESQFGSMNAEQASQAAVLLCTELTSSPATVVDVSRQCAYSSRHKSMVREWNITCDSSQGQYLVRINADTQRVYAINRMDTPPDKTGADGRIDSSALSPDEPIAMTRTVAEGRARQYLQIIGIPSKGLTELELKGLQCPSGDPAYIVPQWNFTFRRSVPGRGKRLLKVSINGETGGLEHVWNPVLAL